MLLDTNPFNLNKVPFYFEFLPIVNSTNNYRLKQRSVSFRERKYERPFWLPALNYYLLTTVVVFAIFFVIWGLLTEGGEDVAFIPAGIIAGLILVTAVFVREVVLRKARQRYIHFQKQLDLQLTNIPVKSRISKLSLEQNADIIKKIQSKSETAISFGQSPEAHWEIFVLCNDYLRLNVKELKSVGIGSPRLPALRRGQEVVSEIQKTHLLIWAKKYTKFYTDQAKNQLSTSDKIEYVQQGLETLKTALKYYPNEIDLIESAEALREYRAKIKVYHWIELAEKNTFKGNHKRALNFYTDALFYLGRENLRNEERESISSQIQNAIAALPDRIREIESADKKA